MEDTPSARYQHYAYGDHTMRILRLGHAPVPPSHQQDTPNIPEGAYKMPEVASAVKAVWEDNKDTLSSLEGLALFSRFMHTKQEALEAGASVYRSIMKKEGRPSWNRKYPFCLVR